MGELTAVPERIQELIRRGEELRREFDAGYRYKWYRFSDANPDYTAWRREVTGAVREVFGPGSPEHLSLEAWERRLKEKAPNSCFQACMDSLKKAAAALASGGSPGGAGRRAAAAEPPGALARASELAAGGHLVSAAAVAGGALERALRRLCELRGLKHAGLSAEELNDLLLAKGACDSSEHRQAALRLNLKKMAEQCYVEKLTPANVAEMISWTGDFVSRRLSGGA